MKKILVLLFGSWLSTCAIAQSPRLLVQGYETDLQHFFSSASAIDSIHLLRKDSADFNWGNGGDPVATIFTKPGIGYLTWKQISEKYGLSPTQRTRRLCINRVVVKNPERVYIEAALIQLVESTMERAWVNVEDAFSGEEFINVKLKSTTGYSKATLYQPQP